MPVCKRSPFQKRGARGDFLLSHPHSNRNIFMTTTITVGLHVTSPIQPVSATTRGCIWPYRCCPCVPVYLLSAFDVRVHEKISSQFWVFRRPAGKARKRRNIYIFRVFATQPDGMHRRLKCDVIFEGALKLARPNFSVERYARRLRFVHHPDRCSTICLPGRILCGVHRAAGVPLFFAFPPPRFQNSPHRTRAAGLPLCDDPQGYPFFFDLLCRCRSVHPPCSFS